VIQAETLEEAQAIVNSSPNARDGIATAKAVKPYTGSIP